MISQCPNCNHVLRFSDAQQQKLVTALGQLTPGRTLKFTCPKCKKPIELNSDGESVKKGKETPAQSGSTKHSAPVQQSSHASIEPPGAPDISWLSSGELKGDAIVDNVPTAMVLMPKDEIQKKVSQALEDHQYQLYFPETKDEAVNSMRFRDFDVVVYHSEYENENSSINNQDFHKFMMHMGMSKRRSVYYILVGPQFKTLFDLEALTYSANLVLNPNEAEHLSTILKKSLADYKALFNPYDTILKEHGKS